ncbi:MAG TPA: hypothetical protein VK181_05505, partial [Rhizobium sp.]|nr:hypothetical protein [Rhizobium sp.]
MTLAELLARQTAELRSLSAEELKSLEPLFEEARESLRQSLEALIARGAEEQFTAAQLKATMAQVESAISVIGKGLRGSLAAATDAAEDAAVRHLQQQAELALQAFGKPVAVDLQTARRFARKNTTLLERHAKFSAGWEQRSIAKVKKTLAVETLRNTPRQDVIRKLTEPGSPLEGSRHD